VQALGRRMGAAVWLENPNKGQGVKAVVQFQAMAAAQPF